MNFEEQKVSFTIKFKFFSWDRKIYVELARCRVRNMEIARENYIEKDKGWSDRSICEVGAYDCACKLLSSLENLAGEIVKEW